MTNGFLIAATPGLTSLRIGRYLPQRGVDSGAMGVAAWNEYPDHVVVSGWREDPSTAVRMDTHVFLTDLAAGVATPINDFEIDGPPTNLRQDRPGFADVLPNHVLDTFAPPLSSISLGPLAGGGVAVDASGAITVVGSSTLAGGSPELTPVGPPGETRSAPIGVVPTAHCLRVVVDMLPIGVCRTDGPGDCPPGAPVGWPPSAPLGRTSPGCALSTFGDQQSTDLATGSLVSAELDRMYIDVVGRPGPNASLTVVLDRPPTGAPTFGVLQFGFSGLVPNTAVLPGAEVWITPDTLAGAPTTTLLFLPVNDSIRVPLAPLPATAGTFTMQFFSGLLQPVCGTPAFTTASSPAIMFGF